MRIKITKVNQVEKFFQIVDSCTANVELRTGEGDCLNLKSKLSQYLSMTRMFSDGNVPDMEIVLNDEEDKRKLEEFLKEDASSCKEKILDSIPLLC